MRINAYIPISEPRWLRASLASYYAVVERIVVVYDERGFGFSGSPINVQGCLEVLKNVDPDGKLEFLPGRYYDESRDPLGNDTHQRQCALDVAEKDADWVIQLDSDEVITDANEFLNCLREADEKGFDALDYPARWFHYALGHFRYLERSRRPWKVRATYPGPIAVRHGAKLNLARQCDAKAFRVDLQPFSTDPAQLHSAVHRVVRPDQAIYHYARVRSKAELGMKTQSSGHAREMEWNAVIERWLWEGRHPHLAALASALPRRFSHGDHQPLRVASAVPPVALQPLVSEAEAIE